MTRHRATIRMRRPGLAERLWHWRLGLPLPAAIGSMGPWHERWVRLLPYRLRRIHHAYARRHGYFWLPCHLCGHEFGGHEMGASIPDPIQPQTDGHESGIGICSRCSIARARAER